MQVCESVGGAMKSSPVCVVEGMCCHLVQGRVVASPLVSVWWRLAGWVSGWLVSPSAPPRACGHLRAPEGRVVVAGVGVKVGVQRLVELQQ